MKESHAAGRKTENTLGQLASHLDRQLARLTTAMGECLDLANAVSREVDEYGHFRAGEIGHAMQIARTSAKLVSSLAKLDREFRHNVTVSRIDVPPPAPAPPARRPYRPSPQELEPEKYLTPEEMDAMTDEELIASMDATLEMEKAERGDPPPNS